MRAQFEAMIAKKPGSMIIFADNAERVACAAIGSVIEVRALHQEGTKALAAMVEKSGG